jgi:hypothetical protein
MKFCVFQGSGRASGSYYWHVEGGGKITASAQAFDIPSKAHRAVAQFWRSAVKAAYGGSGIMPASMPPVPYAKGSLLPRGRLH